MVSLAKLSAFLDDFMGYHDKVPGIDGYLANGLQIAGATDVHKIAVGVSANMQLFQKSVAAGAQALLVHHSINPPNSATFERDVIFSRRYKYLLQHNLSLIGYHYLLDSHPDIGHNVQIIKALGGVPTEPYGRDGWGWLGAFESGLDRDAAMDKCRGLFNNNGVYYPFGKPVIKRMVSMCGAGAPRPNDYEWLMANEIDLFITGEPREWNQELCREAEVSLVAAGHYYTEIIGLQALSKVIRAQFDVEVEFIDVPNIV